MKWFHPALLSVWSPSLAMAAASAEPDASPTRSALAKGEYPWYDIPGDRLKAVVAPPSRMASWFQSFERWMSGMFQLIGDFFGRIARAMNLPTITSPENLVPIFLIVVGTVSLIILIWWLWNSGSFIRDTRDVLDPSIGIGGRVSMLPAEMASAFPLDPWAEAEERRRRGDFTGAIIFLFAYQLLELDRLGLIRLAPGGTGRTYVMSLADSKLRVPMVASLGLFEMAYYGHKAVTASSFERVWAEALGLRASLINHEKRTP